MNQEWRRLQELYAAMSDSELLGLAGAKAELTEVAQQVVNAEMETRGLSVPVEHLQADGEGPGPDTAGADVTLVELTTFQLPGDAERALRELDEREIPVRMEHAMRRLTADGPLVKTNWLTIFVEVTRREEAVALLRERMGLFPVLEPEEVDSSEDEADEEDFLSIVGSFDVEADAETAQEALTGAGIWFKAEKGTEEGAGLKFTIIEARADDLERALEVVEAAFSESE